MQYIVRSKSHTRTLDSIDLIQVVLSVHNEKYYHDFSNIDLVFSGDNVKRAESFQVGQIYELALT